MPQTEKALVTWLVRRRHLGMSYCFDFGPVRTIAQNTPWWTCPRRAPAAPLRLWCLPFVGAGAAIWYPWAAPIARTAEIMAARLPARETRFGEKPLTRVTQVVDALVGHIAQFADEDYALCGHSLGGLVAFELARRLRSMGVPNPRAVIVCATRAPDRPRPEPPVHHLNAREFIAQIEQRYGAIPAEIRDHPDVLELLLPALRADMEIYETYRHVPAAPLDVPILALGGTGDRIVSQADVLGWRMHTSVQCETAFFAAGHFFPQTHQGEVVPVVRRFLEAVVAVR
ncbi:MAG TPA: alpha/beta fold hydrolase [Opitutaceae bacterium]|nr:alpha/beta fold hydrolase [Opitutaceae bacterium]